jgi:hypothetical protein
VTPAAQCRTARQGSYGLREISMERDLGLRDLFAAFVAKLDPQD